MKLRKRDIGERPNTSRAQKRKLQDQQDSRPPGDDTVELGRGKRSRPASKKRPVSKRKPAVLPIEQENGPEPTAETELLVEPPTGDVDDESSQIEEHIIELLSNAPFPKYLQTNGRNQAPMPLSFQRELREQREQGTQSETAEQCYLNLMPRDNDRWEGAIPYRSFLEDVFKTNKETEREEEDPTQAFLTWLC